MQNIDYEKKKKKVESNFHWRLIHRGWIQLLNSWCHLRYPRMSEIFVQGGEIRQKLKRKKKKKVHSGAASQSNTPDSLNYH